MSCSSKKQSIKKGKAAKWIFKRRGADEEENLQLRTDECNGHLSGEQQQQKAKKKRKPETICNQDLCNQMSESDGRNSSRRITDKQDKDKLRCTFLSHSKAKYSLILSGKERAQLNW